MNVTSHFATHARSRTLALAVWLLLGIASSAAIAQEKGSLSPTSTKQHFVSGGTPTAPALSVNVTLDRSTLTVADQLHLTLSAEAPLDFTIALPELPDRVGDFTVANRLTKERFVGAPPKRVLTLELTLEPFLTGERAIGPFTITARDTRSGALHTVTIPVTKFTVESLLPKDAQPTPPKLKQTIDNAELPARLQRRDVLIGVVAVVTLGLGLAAFLWMRSRPAKLAHPLEEALAQLKVARQRADSDIPTALELGSAAIRRLASRTLGTSFHSLTPDQWPAALRQFPRVNDELARAIVDTIKRLEMTRFSPLTASSCAPAQSLLSECEDRIRRLAATVSEGAA